jgi:thiamine transport system substrate-binding protein
MGSRFSRAIALSLLLLATAASAQNAPVLTVYTYSSFAGEYGPGATIKANFERECACILEWVTTEDAGTLIARLRLEGRSTDADIVLGLDNGLLASARDSGLFTPHGLTFANLDLPVAWDDDTFVPFDWGWFAFVYDSTRLAEPPRSLAELIADPNGPTVVIEDPRTSSPGLGLLVWMKAVFGDGAADAWASLAPRIVTVTRGWSEAYGLFLSGEADMVLSYTTSPAYHAIAENDSRYAAAEFTEGHVAQVEVAGILKSSQKQELAKRFLTYLVSPEAQKVIPTTNWMYPVVDIGADLPEAFRNPGPPAKVIPVDEATVTAQSRNWIDTALAALQ